MPRVVVVTVTYNSTPVLEGFLDGFAALAAASRHDVTLVLVDNASSDGSAELARRRIADLDLAAQVLDAPDNLGWSAGNNRGIDAAGNSDYVLLLNPDVVLAAPDLEAMVTALASNADAGAVVPRLQTAAGTVRIPAFPWHDRADATLGLLGWRRRRSAALQRRLRTHTTTTPLADGYLEGSCLLLQRRALAAISPLDERFHLFFDDADLSRRLVDAGFGLLFAGGAQAREMPIKGSRAAPDADAAEERLRRFLAHLSSELRYYEKWWGPQAARRISLHKRFFELAVRSATWRLRYGVRGLAKRGRAVVREYMLSRHDGPPPTP